MTARGKATLHFVCGKIASGKTSLARSLASRHAAVMFCEDEWLTRLDAKIGNFKDFLAHSRNLRAALAPHITELLRLGNSVVLDFAGNGPKDRAWVRAIFEAAGADHLLHVIEASDALCRARLKQRNETKPEGVYWGSVSEALFDEVNPLILPPAEAEGFKLLRHQASDL